MENKVSTKVDNKVSSKTSSRNICNRDNVSTTEDIRDVPCGLTEDQKMMLDIFKVVGKTHAEPSLCLEKCKVFFDYIKSLK